MRETEEDRGKYERELGGWEAWREEREEWGLVTDTHLSEGRVYVKEKLALYVPTGMFTKVGLIPAA